MTFAAFVNQVDGNGVKTATVNPNGHVTGQLANGDHYVSQLPTAIPDAQLATQLQDHKVQVTATAGRGASPLGVIFNLLPLLLFVGYFIWIGRRSRALAGGITGVGRSKAKVYELDDRPKTRFSDVAGCEGAKQEVTEVVDFLRHPDKYRSAGAVGPRGVLMVGPPRHRQDVDGPSRGRGGGRPVPGPDRVQLRGAVCRRRRRPGARPVRRRPQESPGHHLHRRGRRHRRPSRAGIFGGNDEREQTLNQLLAEMDGFDPTTGVVLIAATNRPESLDAALLRPGRFDRTVEIPLPNQVERRPILAVHTPDKQLGVDVDLDVSPVAPPASPAPTWPTWSTKPPSWPSATTAIR